MTLRDPCKCLPATSPPCFLMMGPRTTHWAAGEQQNQLCLVLPTPPAVPFWGLQREPNITGSWHRKVPMEEDDYTQKSGHGTHLKRPAGRVMGIRAEKALPSGRGWSRVTARGVTLVTGIPWLRHEGAWLHPVSWEQKSHRLMADSLASLSVCWSREGRRQREWGSPSVPLALTGPCLPRTGIGGGWETGQGDRQNKRTEKPVWWFSTSLVYMMQIDV